MFCAFHDQLASLGRHAQLTRCFSAVAELLVVLGLASNVSNRIGLKCGKIVLQVDTHRLTESDFRFDVTRDFQDGSHDVISRRKVVPPGELTRNVCRAPMQQCTSVPDL